MSSRQRYPTFPNRLQYPVFRPMRVFLERQNRTWVYDESFDLKPVFALEAIVTAPGPEHLAMQTRFLPILLLEFIDNGFYVLRSRLLRDQHRCRSRCLQRDIKKCH